MPTYQYECAKCGGHVEVYQTFSEEPLKRHTSCGGKLQKVFSPVGIVLKGSGFYKTDSRESARSKSKASETKPAETTSDTKTDTKTETKVDSTNGGSKSDSSSSNGSTNGSSKRSDKPATSKPAKKSA
jgi:putative FmdB family regulatory protein